MDSLNGWAPRVLSVLRIGVALLFIEHGTMLLYHFPAIEPKAPVPLPPILVVGAWLELIGGGLLALGLYARPVAFVLSGEMAVGYFLFHAKAGPWPAPNGGEGAVLFCWLFFYMAFAGPGPWSLDAIVRKRT